MAKAKQIKLSLLNLQIISGFVILFTIVDNDYLII